MNADNILKIITNDINNSDLDVYMKDWFNENKLGFIIKDSGLDWSGRSSDLDTVIEYYVLTKEEDNDYRIVFSNSLNKFGLESRGTVKSSDKYNGQFVKFIVHWMDSPIEILQSM